ncbi:MAG: sensor histidine kinase [Velocimicrobium sp.]
MKKLQSIRYKLLLSMSLIFLVFVAIVLFIWYSALKNQAESTAIRNMESTIHVSNLAFENQVKDIINVASLTTIRTDNSLSTNILNIIEQDSLSAAEIIAYRRSAKDYLISLCSFKKYLNGLMLSNFQGNTVLYGNPTPYQMIIDNNWISLLNDTPSTTTFIEPHYQTKWYANKNDLVFSIMKPVYDLSQKKIGFVIADINCQLFNDSFDMTHYSNTSLYLIDNNLHNVIFASDNNILNLNQSEKVTSSISKQLKGDTGDFFITIKKTKYLVVYNKSTLTNWNTISIIPEKNILAEFSTAAKNVFVITILLLVVMIFLVFTFSSLLTTNITKLTNAVKGIGGENLSLDISITSKDEVADLATQFKSMLTRIKSLLTEIRTKEEEKRTAELAALQFQMNPHFLYNSLNTIKFLASIQGIENIQTVAELLSSLMHTNMDGRTVLSIEEDICFTKSYLTLQTYRHTIIFDYTITAAPEILDYKVPKLFVQPLVENAIKHGLVDKQVGGSIMVEYKVIDSVLHICVDDNGLGMSDERIREILSKKQNTNAGHIGIYNIRERLKLYYGLEYDIKIDSTPNHHTSFEITLPVLENEENKL